MLTGALPPPITWVGGVDGHLALLDQTRLPHARDILVLRSLAGAVDAIRRLAVRGAPAIGVAAAYAVILGVRERAPQSPAAFAAALTEVARALIAARPTAINLAWAVHAVTARGREEPSLEALLAAARALQADDAERCLAMGDAGRDLVEDGCTVLTHCNAGRLATAGDGTALAVLYAAQRAGRRFRVLADETRPLLQGARLTALELAAAGIPVEVVVDGAAAGLIRAGQVQLILTGADRIAANGDVANKVGTYGLALAAHASQVPMWVVAPTSTFDLSIASGDDIPIEHRDPQEVLSFAGIATSVAGVGARNPAFDITPHTLLRGLVTDRGRVSPVTQETIKAVVDQSRS
ncbi:MAG: S-methyl-5-thioribose-1-phosphate isomerase [Planctomycetota bacterium]